MKSLQVLAVFLSAESGQDMIEYALLAAIVGLGAVVSIGSVSAVISRFFNQLAAMEAYI